ncbi:hypothetical protein, partial [Candidatus Villigracilis affinis]|uniref:hypothetical protein n=1 Tax=Candidatus Villigracilis affinis TaxID=3140682 RepID=UPI0031E5A2DF
CIIPFILHNSHYTVTTRMGQEKGRNPKNNCCINPKTKKSLASRPQRSKNHHDLYAFPELVEGMFYNAAASPLNLPSTANTPNNLPTF